MEVKFVYGIFPALVFYTNRLKEGFNGVANGPVVRIRPGRKDDEGLLQHELTHVRQFYRFGMIFPALLYWASEDFRLAAEVEAYAVQLRYSKNPLHVAVDRKRFAKVISTKYGLHVLPEDVEELLLREA